MFSRDTIQPAVRVSQALWGELGLSLDLCADTLATIQLLNLAPDAFIRRSVRGLVERYEKGTQPTDSQFLNVSLFRIHPLERALLVLTYEFSWTAEMLSHTFELEIDELDALLWKSKIDILTHRIGGKLIAIPSAGSQNPQCPEWNPMRPWTARYLDQRLTRADQVFIHGHVDGCPLCRKLLDQTRALLAEAKSTYDTTMPVKPDEKAMNQLMKIFRQGETYALKRPLTLGEAFRKFVQQRRDVQFVLIALMTFFIWKLTQ